MHSFLRPACESGFCSHIPHQPGLVRRQPSPGMTWIHFKSAVTHPGLAPGLSTHLPWCCQPHGPSAVGTAGCGYLPALPLHPPYHTAHSSRAMAARSLPCASSAWYKLPEPQPGSNCWPRNGKVRYRQRQPQSTPQAPAPSCQQPGSPLPAPMPRGPRGNTCPGHPPSPRCKSPGKAAQWPEPATGITPRPGTLYH